jgi:organic hydroperoxide reductase OsmC/OhrA
MSSTTIEYRLMPGTAASLGRSGVHTVIADRPEGKAGGLGLGLNGGELLAFALGGCLSNDLQVLAHEAGESIADLRIAVTLDFGGVPSRTTGARIDIDCRLESGADPGDLIERAKALTNIANSLRTGLPVNIIDESGS